MSLNVLLLTNDGDSEAIKALLKSKIPSCSISFYILEEFVSTTASYLPLAFNYNSYDVCVVKDTDIAQELISLGASAICWDEMKDLSVKFDVFLQLHRNLKKFPLNLRDWRLTEVLHNSQDCIIYKGIDVNATPAAIKRFKFQPNQLSRDSIREHLDGISLQCGIHSDGLVDFYEGGICNHAFYLVMEYLPFGNLRQYLDSRNQVLPLKHALEWFGEIANALDVVHQAGLIHRDLKIDNIMLRDDGSLALTDYGVSKNILLSADFLTEDEFHGSPYYVSPELISGEPCSQSSDIYSLGIVFYELLVGVKPYSANNEHDLMLAHIKDLIPKLPDELVLLQPCLDKTMANRPEGRFKNVTQLLQMFKLACEAKQQTNAYQKTSPHFLLVS